MIHLFQPEAIFIKQISQVEPSMTGHCSLVDNRGYFSIRKYEGSKTQTTFGRAENELFRDRAALKSSGRINLVTMK